MTWGRDSFLLLNVKWDTLSLENNCLLLFTMHPSNLDHKDMQRRGVQTFQAGESGGVMAGGWGARPVNRRGPRTSRLVNNSVSFLLHFSHKQNLTPCEWAMSELWYTPQGLRLKTKNKKSSILFGKISIWLLVRLVITIILDHSFFFFEGGTFGNTLLTCRSITKTLWYTEDL